MPRERVYSQQYRTTPNSPEPTEPQTAVEVVWNRDHGYLQVAATAADGTERVVRIVNQWLEAAGVAPIDLAQVREKLATLPDHPQPNFDGWYVSLEQRQDVNRLIRVLRRARDQAFGRDE